MSKNLLFTIVCFLTLTFQSSSQEFQNLFGSGTYESAKTSIQLPNKNYVIGGLSAGCGPSNSDIIILCLDQLGNEVWSQVCTAGGSGELTDIKLTDDNYLIMTGNVTLLGDGGSAQAFVGKMSTDGVWIWQMNLGSLAMETGKSIEITSDGGFLLTVLSSSYSDDMNQDILLVKGDLDGNIQWSKIYGSDGYENVAKGVETPEGGFLIWGHMNSTFTESYDNFIMKVDINGNLLWTKSFVGPIAELAWDMLVLEDGAILSGDTNSYGEGLVDMYLLKIDWNGNLQWQYTYGEFSNDHAISLLKNGDDNFIVGGISASYGSGGLDFVGINMDLDGNIEWAKIYGGEEKEVMHKVIKTQDEGFLFAGNSRSFEEGSITDIYLVKTNERGDCECNQTLETNYIKSEVEFIEVSREFNQSEVDVEEEFMEMDIYSTEELSLEVLCSFGFVVEDSEGISEGSMGIVSVDENPIIASGLDIRGQASLIHIYPNPSNGLFNFNLLQAEQELLEIKVLNSEGKSVVNLSPRKYMPGNYNMINLEGFDSGIYTVLISSETKFEAQRIILN